MSEHITVFTVHGVYLKVSVGQNQLVFERMNDYNLFKDRSQIVWSKVILIKHSFVQAIRQIIFIILILILLKKAVNFGIKTNWLERDLNLQPLD